MYLVEVYFKESHMRFNSYTDDKFQALKDGKAEGIRRDLKIERIKIFEVKEELVLDEVFIEGQTV